jgi:O-antigen biosynthesis protein
VDETFTSEVPAPFRVVSCEPLENSDDQPLQLNHPDVGIRVVLQPNRVITPGLYRFELAFSPQGVVELTVNFSYGDVEQLWLRPQALDRGRFGADVRVAGGMSQISILVRGSGELQRPIRFSFARRNRAQWLMGVARRGWQVLKRDRLSFIHSAAFALFRFARPGMLNLSLGSAARAGESPYETWIRLFDEHPLDHRRRHEERLASLANRPLICCLSRLKELDISAIKQLAGDLNQQIYQNWHLLVAVPASLSSTIEAAFASSGIDKRLLTLIPGSDDDASSLNSLVAAATGDWIVKIPSRATLRPHALLELALVVDRFPNVEMIYCDEDTIDQHGRRSEPKFKPAWSPHYLVATDYIGPLMMVRRQLLLQIGGWRPGFEAACDRDLKLRLAEKAAPNAIVHLAKILVHLPPATQPEPSTTSDTRLLNDLIARRRERAVVKSESTRWPSLHYLPLEPQELVSIIIPTRDRADLLELCVRSILGRTLYRAYEIVVVDNDSKEPATHRLLDDLQHTPQIRVLRSPGAFNYSALNNFAARAASGKLLALLNNDIEVIDGGWLGELVALSQRPEVGCVGAKLLYPGGQIQHAGVVTGLRGLAGHAYRDLPRDAPGYMNQLRFTHEVSVVTAACLVVRKSVYFEVGGFDEKELKVAFNDVDFCLKVRKAGYLNLWSPSVELLHHESASRGFEFYSLAKTKRFSSEVNTIQRRWGEVLFNDPYYSPNLTLDGEDYSPRVQ